MNGTTEMPTAEKPSRAVLVAEVENRVQFNVFVSIFFCALLFAFLRSLDKSDIEANKVQLHWATVTACYLFSYVVFECGRSVITDRWLKGIDVLLIGSALFVLPMSIMAALEAKWFGIEVLLAPLSLWGITIMALLLIFPTIFGIGAGLYDRRCETFRSAWSWWRTKMEGDMSQRTFSLVAAVVFALVAHCVCCLRRFGAHVGKWDRGRHHGLPRV